MALLETQRHRHSRAKMCYCRTVRIPHHKQKRPDNKKKRQILNSGRNEGQGCPICQGDTLALQGDASATNQIQQKE